MAKLLAPRLVLLCGLPGAGKTTRANQLQDSIPAIRLCPDEWIAALNFPLHDTPRRARLETLFWQLAQILLRQGISVILEFGFWSRSERDAKRLGARSLGVAVELHYLAAPVEELWRRLEIRNQQQMENTAPITHQQLLGWSSIFQPPDATEMSLFDASLSQL